MKKLLSILFLIVALTGISFAQELPQVPDQAIETLQFPFNGQWMPSVDPLQVGPENYRVLTNLRYNPSGSLESVGGYSKINTTVVTSAPQLDAGIQFKKDNPAETHVLINADGIVYQNTTAIPSQGDFAATALHTDAAGASAPRFSQAPYGHVAYTNGKETMIWAGNEMPVAAFITSTAAVVQNPTNPKDYTEAVNNDLTDGQNVAVIGGGVDAYTKLLMHIDEADAGTAFDDAVGTHNPANTGDAQADTAQAKFGISSGLFDGNGDYISVADHADWFMNAAAFTVDFWVRWPAVPADDAVYGLWQQRTNDDNIVYFYYNRVGTDGLVLKIRAAAAETVSVGPNTWVPTANTWYHIALIRGWGGVANTWAITINGGVYSTGSDADVWPDLAAAFHVGISSPAGGPYYHTGWIDEFRVSKGIARWTATFTPPVRAYSTAARTWLIGSPRQLKGVKYYLSNVNTVASTLSVSEWQGYSWTALTVTDNTDTGASLAQTGTVTWTNTGQAKPKFIENRLLYWYQFSIDAGEAEIYRVSLDAPWQNLVDIWDGVYRQPIQFQAYKSAKYQDYTYDVNDENADTYFADLGGLLNSEHVILMFDDRTTALNWTMVAGKENTTAATVTIYYWDGGTWATVGPVTDTTLDAASRTKSLGQSGHMSWNPPDEEVEFYKTSFGVTGYAYKLVWSDTLLASNSQVNTLYGVPAQKTIHPVKFPAIYKDRLFLCGYSEGGQGNRCDYSMAYTPQVFNGAQSSDGGTQSLFFGGSSDLTAATQLYNRMGSNIFIFFLALKESETYVLTGDGPETYQIYPVSTNIGCPAPKSLVVAEVGFDIASDVQRHVALWVSYAGPVIFDGAVIYQVPGIENYFDPNSADYLGQTSIRNFFGWFDQTYREYNIVSGSFWVAYNLKLKRWFRKDTNTAEYPISAWPVRDTYGNECVYAGLDNGYMMRLENGTSWDGVGINQRVQTGDFWPTKNMWDMTRIRRIKIATKRISAANALTVVHYGDGEEVAVTNWSWEDTEGMMWEDSSEWVWDTGNSVMILDVSGGSTGNRNRIIRSTQPVNLLAWVHGLRFEMTTSDTEKGFQPIIWGVEYMKERRDH